MIALSLCQSSLFTRDNIKMSCQFSTPILLIAWRRPHTVRRVIEALRPAEPKYIFVACDGPSPNRCGEYEKVMSTRAVIEHEIDWPCQISRLYSNVNLGCKLGVSRAISWFFQNCEEGIVLEDDCIPHPDFIHYCAALLERYRNDNRVWCISGSNFQDGHKRGNGSYYFSRYNHCWGWASWRRCWEHYDLELTNLPQIIENRLLQGSFSSRREYNYWINTWKKLKATGDPDTWDYQWTFTCFSNGGLTALPNSNLVINDGFGPDATHTIGKQKHAISWGEGMQEIVHPAFVLPDYYADLHTFKRVYYVPVPIIKRLYGLLARSLKLLVVNIARRVTVASSR